MQNHNHTSEFCRQVGVQEPLAVVGNSAGGYQPPYAANARIGAVTHGKQKGIIYLIKVL